VRKFVDWVANKAPDFTATTAKKQRWSGRVPGPDPDADGAPHRQVSEGRTLVHAL